MEDQSDIEEILSKAKAEETTRGKLKIFFGAAAGVGKTYAMLESARIQKKEGVDIVIGWVETHKRVETEALLEGLEMLPAKIIKYKNVDLCEFDIDAALKRNSALILVDEMAHTNAPGSRHPKRWQDIEELLDNGIDVYTTLNVQHCESATDVVTQITGITVRETVPDTMVEKADEIELVDLPTENLLKRLKEGKVYIGEMALRAAEHFFQPGNLIALRQLALRYTAHNVDEKLLSYKQAHAVSKVWGARDRFLVCISQNPHADGLIRAGKRIASDLGVGWTVAYVETPMRLKQKDKDRISEMMRIAEKLGANVVTLSGQDIADALISYARSKNITKIIVGKPAKLKWYEYISGSIIDKLARKCGEIDLYLLSGEAYETTYEIRPPAMERFSRKNLIRAITIIALCTFVDWILAPQIAPVNLVMVYLLGVAWIAYSCGRRISIIASFLSVLFFDFFFVKPHFTFAVADVEYMITFTVMLVVGLTISHLTGQLRRQTLVMRLKEDKTQVLYAFSRDLSKSSYTDELFRIALKHIHEFFKCHAIVFIPQKHKKLATGFGDIKELAISQNELAVAQWSYENKKIAGMGTDTLPGSRGIYLPFSGAEKIVGVIGVFPDNDKQFVDPEQFHILEMFISQTALAVEGAQLAAAAIDAEAKVESERLRNMLLSTFSLDLPKPLKIISEAASDLLKPENTENKIKRDELIRKIKKEADRLNDISSEMTSIIESKE